MISGLGGNTEIHTKPLGAIRVGCAGWSIPSPVSCQFPLTGSHLERYSHRFSATEINTSFYRPHKGMTYARWAAVTPADFRFAVKAPKLVTHDSRLQNVTGTLDRFIDEVSCLGHKLGPLLFQFPPSLPFERMHFEAAFSYVRRRFTGPVVYEPRHRSWFEPGAVESARTFTLSLVQADPPIGTGSNPADELDRMTYLRLHGSPRRYYSSYGAEALQRAAELLVKASQGGRESWCVFDNTAAGAAIPNAFELRIQLEARFQQCAIPSSG